MALQALQSISETSTPVAASASVVSDATKQILWDAAIRHTVTKGMGGNIQNHAMVVGDILIAAAEKQQMDYTDPQFSDWLGGLLGQI